MAHWFHRNPLKATEPYKFDFKGVARNDAAGKAVSILRLQRDKFLRHLECASTDLEQVEAEFNQYLGLFYGFVFDPSNPNATESKLRNLIRPIWGNSMIEREGIELSDAWFEALNMTYNMAIWYMKHAAWVSAKDEVRDNEAKTIHTCLRRAAGMFDFIKFKAPILCGLDDFPGSDFHVNVIKAYMNQCIAEAQEVTIARAIELKHAASLISKLSTETAKLYESSDKLIENFNPALFGRWRSYFQLKHKFYLSYAYAYLSEALLAEDKCGLAVRCCKEGIKCYDEAIAACTQYSKSSGPGFLAKPESHLFFRRIQPLLERNLDKATRENSLIYHERVPDEVPPLDENASYGLATPLEFEYPPPNETWVNGTAYVGFEISHASTPDFGKAKKSKTKLTPVREEKVYQTDKDPKNLSGCSVM